MHTFFRERKYAKKAFTRFPAPLFLSEVCASAPSKLNNVPSEVLQGQPAYSCRSSPRAISTGQLHTLLHFHLRPIYDIVYVVPYSSRDERSYLRESFTLRCFQRLSRPHLATLLCRWHDNRCTRGTSIPVLSYYGQLPANLLRPQQIGTELSHDVLNPARVPL